MRKVGIVLAAFLALAGRGQAGEPPPLKLYAQPAAAISARLSPDGTRVALIATYEGRQVLFVHSLVEGGTDGKIVRTEDYEIHWVRWKDDQHLVAGVRSAANRLFSTGATGQYSVGRLVSFDANGEHVKMIGEPEGGFFNRGDFVDRARHVRPQNQDVVLSMLPQTPGRVLQQVLDKLPVAGERLSPTLFTVDIETGDHEMSDEGDARMTGYVVDHNGIARIGIEQDRLDLTYYTRATSAESWHKIHQIKINDGDLFRSLAFLSDNPQLFYVISNKGPDGKAGLWSFDSVAGKFADLIDDQADLAWPPSVEDGVLLGYKRKDGSWVYMNPAWQADYMAVRKALKGAELRLVDRTTDGTRVLFEAHQPHQPKTWWLLDRTVKPLNLWPAVEQYPDLPAQQMAPVKEVSYQARDGLMIPAYLTLPVGYKEGPLPFIVLPHGGPYVCEGTDFDYESQFLASRGWGVLQPQFRGTACYGPEFERRGYREWGFAMQDDLTDGTRWLIEQHYADPARICIVGGSYGGYAALEGVEKEPDLYRCAAAWAPVTDISGVRDHGAYTRYVTGILDRIGDDRGRLTAASPVLHVDRIKVPILLMHGKQDYTVHFSESVAMEKALRAANKPVEAIYLDHADHYRPDEESRGAWLSALDKFLSVQLGKP